MRAGTLREHIRIERPTEARDAYGAVTVTWTTFAECFAAAEFSISREQAAGGNTGLVEMTEGTFTIRWLDGVNADMRVIYRDRIFQLRGVRSIERDAGLELIGTEVTRGN